MNTLRTPAFAFAVYVFAALNLLPEADRVQAPLATGARLDLSPGALLQPCPACRADLPAGG